MARHAEESRDEMQAIKTLNVFYQVGVTRKRFPRYSFNSFYYISTWERESTFSGRPSPFTTSYFTGREDKRTHNKTMRLYRKYNGAAGYQSPVKIELGKGTGLLTFS